MVRRLIHIGLQFFFLCGQQLLFHLFFPVARGHKAQAVCIKAQRRGGVVQVVGFYAVAQNCDAAAAQTVGILGRSAGGGNAFELNPVFLGVDYVEQTEYNDTKISVSITLSEDCKDIYFVAGMTDGDNNNDNYFQDVIAENVMMAENKRTFYPTAQSNAFTNYLNLFSNLLNASEILNIPQPSMYAFVWRYYLKEGKAGTTYTFTKQRYGKDVFVFAYALNKNGETLKFKTLT